MFKNDISSSELCVNSFTDIDELSRCYDTTLSSILDKHAPMTTKRMVVKPVVPWFTDDLKKLKAERRNVKKKCFNLDAPVIERFITGLEINTVLVSVKPRLAITPI